jgi:hypothetical protein
VRPSARRRAPRTHRCGERGHGRGCTDAGRSHRTLDRRTPDTGHRTSGRWTYAPDAGHWMGGHRTGQTLDTQTLTGKTQTRRRTRHGGHPDILAPRRRWGRRTALRWAAPTALGNNDGSAVRPPAIARLPAALPGGCSVAPPVAERALAHCCPAKRNVGLSVAWWKNCGEELAGFALQ